MQGFDIKGVEFKKEETPELLTGEKITELQPDSDIHANSEVEENEYIQFPDGTTQKAEGETHEKGGLKMSLPDGTKVLSDNLTLTKEDVKILDKEFGLKMSTSSTFAEVLDKYVKKIGLAKLYEEQEEVFEVLKLQLENKKTPEATMRVNKEYLSKKIYDFEQQKVPKEQEKGEFFNVLFGMQEGQKKPEQTAEEPKFKNGGVSRASFDALCKKHGMSPSEGIKMLEDGGILTPKYGNGDTVEDKPFSGTFKVFNVNNDFSSKDKYPVIGQRASKGAGYGEIDSKEELQAVLQNLYENFPDIVGQEDVLKKYFNIKEGRVVLTEQDLDFNKVNKSVEEFQIRSEVRMEDSANTIINNPSLFSEEQINSAKDYLKNETFTKEGVKAVRGVDAKLGNFTSGRYSLGLDLVTPDELKELRKQGIYTVNQLKDSKNTVLSTESKARLAKLLEVKGENADFQLGQYDPIKPVEELKKDTDPTKKEQDPAGDITDKVKLPNKKNYPTMFFNPDQSVLPPSPQQAETMVTNRLQRIDPTRIGIEDTLRQLSDSRQFVSDQMDTLPPTQRAAALSSLLAQTQTAENDAFLNTNITNAQNQSQAELFNIGQAQREDVSRTNNLLDYETRALQGAAKTEEDYRNYFDFNRKQALNNYSNQRNMNLLNSLFPDYQLNFTGTQVDYDPNNPNWEVQADGYRRNVIDVMGEQILT